MISFSYEYMDKDKKYDLLKSFFPGINLETVSFSFFLHNQNEISLKFFQKFKITCKVNDFKNTFCKSLDEFGDLHLWSFYFCSKRDEFFERIANFYGLSYYLSKFIADGKSLNNLIIKNKKVLKDYLRMSKEFNMDDETIEPYVYSLDLEQKDDSPYYHVIGSDNDFIIKSINFKDLEKQVESALVKHDKVFNELEEYMPNVLCKEVIGYI